MLMTPLPKRGGRVEGMRKREYITPDGVELTSMGLERGRKMKCNVYTPMSMGVEYTPLGWGLNS